MQETNGQYGSIPLANNSNYGSVPMKQQETADSTYGQAPQPLLLDAHSHYGQAPAELKPVVDAHSHYGQAPAELRPPTNNNNNNFPPPMRAGLPNTANNNNNSGQPRRLSPRGGFPLPAPIADSAAAAGSGQYGSVPPPVSAATRDTSTSGQYGATPNLRKEVGNQQYGMAPPPVTAPKEPAGGNSQYGVAPAPVQQQSKEASGAYGVAPKPKLNESFKSESFWKPNWSRQAADTVLKKAPDTAGIVRPSSTPNTYCVSYKMGAEVLHTLVEVDFEVVKFVVVDVANARLLFETMAQVMVYLGVTPYVDVPAVGGGGGGGVGGGVGGGNMAPPAAGRGAVSRAPSNAVMQQPVQNEPLFIPQPSRSPELQRRTTSPNGNWGAPPPQQQQQNQRGGSNGFAASPGRVGGGRGQPMHAPSAQSVRIEGSAPMGGDFGRNNGYGVDDFNTPGYGQAPPPAAAAAANRPGQQRNPVGNPNFRTGY
jgi:hypothetical protein